MFVRALLLCFFLFCLYLIFKDYNCGICFVHAYVCDLQYLIVKKTARGHYALTGYQRRCGERPEQVLVLSPLRLLLVRPHAEGKVQVLRGRPEARLQEVLRPISPRVETEAQAIPRDGIGQGQRGASQLTLR